VVVAVVLGQAQVVLVVQVVAVVVGLDLQQPVQVVDQH
jgi:hypothetical protein